MPLAGIFPIPAVRSYVRRGRPTNSQRRALQQLRGRYVLAIDDISPVPARQSGLPDTTADWRTIFSRTAPLIADIGFGDGRATAALAAAHPECDHVAFEVHTARCRRIDESSFLPKIAKCPHCSRRCIVNVAPFVYPQRAIRR